MITLNPPIAVARGVWKLTWSSDLDDPHYAVYQDGRLIGKPVHPEFTVTVPRGDSPVFDIFDDSEKKPPRVFPSQMILAWYATPNSAAYRIEESIDEAWTELAMTLDDGRHYFLWRSRTLEDSEIHSFRITAIGKNGNEADPTVLSALMVRHPDPPAVQFSYDPEDQSITIDL